MSADPVDADGPIVVDLFGAGWRLDPSGLGEVLGRRVLALWHRARVPVSSGHEDVEDFVVRRRDGGGLELAGSVHGPTPDDEVPYALSRALTSASIARRTGHTLMFHAAGLAFSGGETLALVAPSGTGKTTAARVLGRDLGYVTDETLAVETDLTVLPYPKPLSVVDDPAEPTRKTEWSPDELGLRAPTGPLRLAGVVLLHRDPGVDEPALDAVGLVEGAAEVLSQTSAVLALPEPMTRLARALTVGGGPWRLTYRDIGDCLALLTDLLERPAEPRADWWAEVGSTGGTPVSAPAAPPGPTALHTWVERTPFTQALHEPGATLVMLGQLPHTVPGLGALAWRQAATPVPVERILAAAVAEHGAHPDAERVIVDTVDVLVDSGLLRRVVPPV